MTTHSSSNLSLRSKEHYENKLYYQLWHFSKLIALQSSETLKIRIFFSFFGPKNVCDHFFKIKIYFFEYFQMRRKIKKIYQVDL